jgi:hypothetical protein
VVWRTETEEEVTWDDSSLGEERRKEKRVRERRILALGVTD